MEIGDLEGSAEGEGCGRNDCAPGCEIVYRDKGMCPIPDPADRCKCSGTPEDPEHGHCDRREALAGGWYGKVGIIAGRSAVGWDFGGRCGRRGKERRRTCDEYYAKEGDEGGILSRTGKGFFEEEVACIASN
jgi:hypothetical protein